MSRLKLTNDRNAISAWLGNSQADWQLLGTAEIQLGAKYLAGFAVASGDASQFSTAQFGQIFSTDPRRVDTDGDGFSDIFEYALGYDSLSAADKPSFSYTLNDSSFQVTLTRRIQQSDVTLLAESSEDLLKWTPLESSRGPLESDESQSIWKISTKTGRQRFVRFSVVTR